MGDVPQVQRIFGGQPMKNDNVIPLRQTPNHATEPEINRYWELAVQGMRDEAARLLNPETMFGPPILPSEVPDIFLAPRRRMAYDPIPVGHNTGWRCYDGSKHDAESAFEAGEFGDGMSQDEAYCAWLREIDEPEPHATSAERELDEAIDEALDFDRDLEDPRE
jgi:hypothetical protein